MSVSHTPEVHAHAHPELGFLRKYMFSEDHKVIGIQFLFSGIIALFLGGFLALLVRIQLGWPSSCRFWARGSSCSRAQCSDSIRGFERSAAVQRAAGFVTLEHENAFAFQIGQE